MLTDNLKSLMAHRQIGNKELSEKSGIPLGTLNKIIYGDTKNPTLENMQAIAHALGCTLDDFVRSDSSTLFSLSASEDSLVKKYHSLDDHGRRVIDFLLDEEYARCCLTEADIEKARAELLEKNAPARSV